MEIFWIIQHLICVNDIIRGHKILYVSLPGTKSKQNLGLLGKMIVAQIKSDL